MYYLQIFLHQKIWILKGIFQSQCFLVFYKWSVLCTVASYSLAALHPILHITSPRFFFVLIQSVWSVTATSGLHSFQLSYLEFVWLQNDQGYVLLSQPRLPLLAVYHMVVWICDSCQLAKCLICLPVFQIICMVPASVIWSIFF